MLKNKNNKRLIIKSKKLDTNLFYIVNYFKPIVKILKNMKKDEIKNEKEIS